MAASRILVVTTLATLCPGGFGLSAYAAEPIIFKDKVITVLVGTTTGGSTDLFARMAANFLSKHLPGSPRVIVQNRPGGGGITATNFFAQQAELDGLTILVGSTAQIDPMKYRVPQAKYDPTKFAMIGGIEIGGQVLIVRNEALPRLSDRKAEPVTMGSMGGFPHTGMLMTAWGIEYLGWNARWVSGYRGTPDLMLALQRGEFDTTTVVWTFLDPSLLDKKAYTILYQTGSKGGTTPSILPALQGIPLFSEVMKGKISDPVGENAFDYWRSISATVKWAALPPNTPEQYVAAYREAFRATMKDSEFLAQCRKVSEDFTVISPEDLTEKVQLLAKVPHDALTFLNGKLQKQGLNLVETTRGPREE